MRGDCNPCLCSRLKAPVSGPCVKNLSLKVSNETSSSTIHKLILVGRLGGIFQNKRLVFSARIGSKAKDGPGSDEHLSSQE